jgi:hypothetical protein
MVAKKAGSGLSRSGDGTMRSISRVVYRIGRALGGPAFTGNAGGCDGRQRADEAASDAGGYRRADPGE